jgi:hypothetical protein
MLHMVGRTDLIRLCQAGARSRACQRAFSNGRVEVLGVFNPITPRADRPGWLIRVTSINGTDWYLSLVDDLTSHHVCPQSRAYWENWAGDPLAERWTLTSGDSPELYGRYRDEAQATPTSAP